MVAAIRITRLRPSSMHEWYTFAFCSSIARIEILGTGDGAFAVRFVARTMELLNDRYLESQRHFSPC